MENKIIKLKIKQFKKMLNPSSNINNDVSKYVGFVQCNSIDPEIEDWMSTNPREQNLKSKISQQIIRSLTEESTSFHDLNRGIVFSVKSIKWNNENEIAEVVFEDDRIHGNIDGGHTLKCILELKKDNRINDNKYVFVEFFENLKDVSYFANTRNTFQPIDDYSIANLSNKFKIFDELLGNQNFYKRVVKKQNEKYSDENEKSIKIIDVLSILNLFNPLMYSNTFNSENDNEHPINSYNSKGTIWNKSLNFLKKNNIDFDVFHRSMKDIYDKIFDLYEQIENELPKKINSNNKKYGFKKYSEYKTDQKGNAVVVAHSFIESKELNYKVPSGLLMPVMGSFRALISKKDNKYVWKVDPFEVWKEFGEQIGLAIFDFSEDYKDNPNAVGKSKNIWNHLFILVKDYSQKFNWK